MRRVVGAVSGVAVLCTGLVVGLGPGGASARPQSIAWVACGGASRAECGSVRVPLDPAEPYGQQITIAVNRIKGSAPRDGNHLGVLLVNPGGPGASGTALAAYVATKLPKDLAARYDVIGFDPRGVGASKPALSCVDIKRYYAAPRADSVPQNHAEESALLGRAEEFATGCANRWSWFLPYLTTENTARDLDVIRQALGEEKISYLGYSYGTYLGAVYATLFPQRVRRMVLDSVVDPEEVWYQANIAQNYAFDRRHRDFLSWVAANHSVYRIGDNLRAVEFAWYAMRQRLRTHPAGGIVGPSELDDIFMVGGYTNTVWPQLGRIFSEYVRSGDTTGLIESYHKHAENDVADENGYAVYLGVQCRDAAWPKTWAQWHADAARVHAKAPFMAWPNTVYNAPCVFWPERGVKPVKVGTKDLPPMLLLQAERDAATPYEGALSMRAAFPTARLVAEPGGNHGVALSGNACVDRQVITYLREGVLAPRRQAGRVADLTCPSQPAPRPLTPMTAEASSGRGSLASILLGDISQIPG
ncbi:peptidase [Acrocarpospora pleiomorpha]|uniref:Peptidase n=1 Tax=Acrocarpospora pleiomorpha TaxID=90975 RepID=A0A5M3XTX2_9ACTN|nr:alpha/beta hydrolase [Acrocarpospora pleiomorpha]GES22723.1 peptidase [Acrocarpospora pleiomorpha]